MYKSVLPVFLWCCVSVCVWTIFFHCVPLLMICPLNFTIPPSPPLTGPGLCPPE